MGFNQKSRDNPLRRVSTEQLEEKMAGVLEELTGEPYNVSIKGIEYGTLRGSAIQTMEVWPEDSGLGFGTGSGLKLDVDAQNDDSSEPQNG